jgi:surface polysaccharide O-acyltransferase-like enzyme
MQQENKTLWFDNLRVIATIGVIFIHVSSDYAPSSGSITAYNFWVGNIFDSASRFSVPLFVMLSGALLLSKDYGIKVFLKKRLFRLVLPFLFWSLIYISNSLFRRVQDGETLYFFNTIKDILIQLRDGSSIHFWYIYMIIGVYLFIPIIGKWVRIAGEKEMKYFLAIWIFTLIFNQPVIEDFKPDIDLSYFSGFLGYLIVGYYISVKSFHNQKRVNIISTVMILVGLLSTIFGTYLVLYFKNEYVSTFYECLSPNIFLFSTGIFLLCKNKDLSNKTFVTIRDFISQYSYGIFLVHVLVLSYIDDLGIRWNFINPVIGIPTTVFVCLIISSVIIYLVNKVPYGKYISG